MAMKDKSQSTSINPDLSGKQGYTSEERQLVEYKRLTREALLKEIYFRMDKLWRLFSWASGLLIAITGGVIVLNTADQLQPLLIAHKMVLSFAVIILATYSVIWLRQNLNLEREARDALDKIDQDLGITGYRERLNANIPRPDKGRRLGYDMTVILLSIAAVLATFIDHF